MGRQNIFDGFFKLFYNEILLTCSMSRTLTQQKGKEKEQRERERERERAEEFLRKSFKKEAFPCVMTKCCPL